MTATGAPSSLTSPAVVVFVDDVRRAAAFYANLAQLAVLHEADDHVVIGTSGLELVIHALPVRETEQRNGRAYALREDAYVKLCLPVASIAEARSRAAALGGAILPEAQEWEARGFRACDGHDPEGNVIQVREKMS